MPNDNTPALDKDSRAELEAVKKGKSRRFVMLCKGVTIVSLVVYKKGSVESYKKQAKEAGTGQIYYGVVHGPAPEVAFELAASEGFDKEPVKSLVLKQFLEDAGFKFKPVFKLVAEQSTVQDDDDAAPAPQATSQTATPQSPTAQSAPSQQTAQTPTSTAGGNEMQIFSARLKAIKPELDDLVATGGKEGLEAKEIAADLPEIVKTKDFVKGNAALDKIEGLLDASTPGVVPNAPPLPPNAKPVTSPDRKLAAALRFLGPDLSLALKAYPDRKAEIDKLKVGVDLCIKSGKFEEGEQLIGRLDELLKTLGSVDPEKAAEFREPWRLAKEVWDDAVADVRGQMNELQNLLVSVDNDEDLLQIGEFGLNAVTQSHLVPIRAALMEIDASGADRLKTSAKKLQNLLGEFRKHIETSPKVQACEENPFGVNVRIKDTLEPGFDALENGLNFITAG